MILKVVQEGSWLIQGSLNHLNIYQASIYELKEEELPSQRPSNKSATTKDSKDGGSFETDEVVDK